MTVESAADRAAMLDTDEFGATATIGAETFPCIQDKEYLETLEISSVHPVALCDESVAMAAGAAVGATVTIDGTAYKIRDLQPDGTGMTLLILEEQ